MCNLKSQYEIPSFDSNISAINNEMLEMVKLNLKYTI